MIVQNSRIDDHNLATVVFAVIFCPCRTGLVLGENTDPVRKAVIAVGKTREQSRIMGALEARDSGA